MKRILLVNPPSGLYIREERCQLPILNMMVPFPRMPLDLCIMSNALNTSGFDSKICDYPAEGKGLRDLYKELNTYKPDFLLLNCTLTTLKKDLRIAKLIKKNFSIKLILKGANFYDKAFSHRVILAHPFIDFIITGDFFGVSSNTGFKKFPFEGKFIFRNKGELIHLDNFIEQKNGVYLKVNRKLIDNKLYRRADNGEIETTILVQRGCSHSCNFCPVKLLSGNKIIYRNADSVINEIKESYYNFGIKNFFLKADNFTLDRKWALGLLEKISQINLPITWISNGRSDSLDEELVEKMAASGCRGLALGIESANKTVLEKLNKPISMKTTRQGINLLNRNGLISVGMFMLGLPWDTQQSIRETIDFSVNSGISAAEFNHPLPFKGTELYNIMKKSGLLKCSLIGKDYSKPVADTFYLSKEELKDFRKKAYRAFYLRRNSALNKTGLDQSFLITALRKILNVCF